MEENFQSTKSRLKPRGRFAARFACQWGFLFFWVLAFALFGCATGPPPVTTPTPTTTTKLTFQVGLNNNGTPTTQFTTSAGTYLGIYRIVINTLNTSLIGNQFAITTSPDTWTDYFELDSGGWIRNHRIAQPNSQQPQQFTGQQAITPGTISGNSFTLVLSLPDQYLGAANKFNVSVISYIALANNPGLLFPVDALGPQVSSSSPIDFISFDNTVSATNNKPDPSGDWTSYSKFPDITSANYQNFDITSLTVSEQR